jgi:transcriptional regulator with XRE-family HTH domain
MNPALANAALAATIRARRAATNMTQRDLAKASGVNYETLKNLETGTQKITMEQIIRLAGPLKRTPESLVQEAVNELEILSAESMSEGAPENVLTFPKRPDTVDEIESYQGQKAAHRRDAESDEPEDN